MSIAPGKTFLPPEPMTLVLMNSYILWSSPPPRKLQRRPPPKPTHTQKIETLAAENEKLLLCGHLPSPATNQPSAPPRYINKMHVLFGGLGGRKNYDKLLYNRV